MLEHGNHIIVDGGVPEERVRTIENQGFNQERRHGFRTTTHPYRRRRIIDDMVSQILTDAHNAG
jgi:hypothetical protein